MNRYVVAIKRVHNQEKDLGHLGFSKRNGIPQNYHFNDDDDDDDMMMMMMIMMMINQQTSLLSDTHTQFVAWFCSSAWLWFQV